MPSSIASDHPRLPHQIDEVTNENKTHPKVENIRPVDQPIEDLTHCNGFDAIRKLGQRQKLNGTKDTNNGPWEMTHCHIGTQLVEL